MGSVAIEELTLRKVELTKELLMLLLLSISLLLLLLRGCGCGCGCEREKGLDSRLWSVCVCGSGGKERRWRGAGEALLYVERLQCGISEGLRA